MSVGLRGLCLLIFDIMMVVAFLFLLRGHNHPGGGFIASLVAASALGVYLFSFSQLPPFFVNYHQQMIGYGLFTVLVAALAGPLLSKQMLTGVWLKMSVFGNVFKLGTPLLFDIGLFLILIGSLCQLLLVLEIKID